MAAVPRRLLEAAVVAELAALGEHVLDRPRAAKALVDALQRVLVAEAPAAPREPAYAAELCRCPSHARSAMWAVSDGKRHALMHTEAAARDHAEAWSSGKRAVPRLLIWHGIGS